MQSMSRAARYYTLAATIERKTVASEDGTVVKQKPSSESAGDAHSNPAVPAAALSDSAKQVAAASTAHVSWQGQYAEAFMLEAGLSDAGRDLGAAAHAYFQIVVRTNFAPRPLAAAVVAIHRCAARAVAEPVVAAFQPLATVARAARRALLGV